MPARYVVRISPSDVGRRVSVRFRLRDARPGAAATDAVGVLRSWEDGRLTIERRDGTVAVVGESDLLAGRAVGPPPRRRRGRG